MVATKRCGPTLTRAIYERLRGELLMIKRIYKQALYFTLLHFTCVARERPGTHKVIWNRRIDRNITHCSLFHRRSLHNHLDRRSAMMLWCRWLYHIGTGLQDTLYTGITKHSHRSHHRDICFRKNNAYYFSSVSNAVSNSTPNNTSNSSIAYRQRDAVKAKFHYALLLASQLVSWFASWSATSSLGELVADLLASWQRNGIWPDHALSSSL